MNYNSVSIKRKITLVASFYKNQKEDGLGAGCGKRFRVCM